MFQPGGVYYCNPRGGEGGGVINPTWRLVVISERLWNAVVARGSQMLPASVAYRDFAALAETPVFMLAVPILTHVFRTA